MPRFGILDIACYVPGLRVPKQLIAEAHAWSRSASPNARGTRAAAAFDEDSLTMAVEAGRSLLNGANASPTNLLLASTSLPFADRSNAGLAAEALNLSEWTATQDCGGSQRAATSALRSLPGRAGASLLIASERRIAKPGSALEMNYGDGAAAVLIGEGEVYAHWLAGVSINADLVDHYRSSGQEHDYTLEARWLRDEGYLGLLPRAIEKALADAELTSDAVDWLLLPAEDRSAASAVIRRSGLSRAREPESLLGSIGHTGVAHPLIQLHQALAACSPGEVLLLCGFGQGADVIVLKASERVGDGQLQSRLTAALTAAREETAYTRFLASTGQIDMDWGLRAERDNRTAQSAFYRNRGAISGLMGGRCTHCGTIQFPASPSCVNPACRVLERPAPYCLREDAARVKTFTEDWLAYSPQPPFMYGNVQFENGANIMMEYTDFAVGQLQPGLPVRMTFRIKDRDPLRHFHRYFWKAAPLAAKAGH